MTSLRADVAVIGAGPAGIAAAVCAAEGGRSVALVDEAPLPGGQIWRQGPGAHLPAVAREWLDRLARSRVTMLSGASVIDVASDAASDDTRFLVTAERAGAPLGVRARDVVIATGARERFLPFPGWTLPGVIGIGGAEALLIAGLRVAGKRVVIAGSGPLLLPVAASLAGAGARVTVVAEQAPRDAVMRFAIGLWRSPAMLLQAARYRLAFFDAQYALGSWVTSVTGTDRVTSVTLTDGTRRWTEPCDLLCTGYGLVPNTALAHRLGCATDGGFVTVDGWQRTSSDGVYCAGEPTGIGGVELALVEGEIAGRAIASAARDDARSRALSQQRAHLRGFAMHLARGFALREELRTLATPETIICRCEDVRLKELDPTWSARQAKLYARVAMGPCQGRVCGAAMEYIRGWTPDTIRPPTQPALLSTLGAAHPES